MKRSQRAMAISSAFVAALSDAVVAQESQRGLEQVIVQARRVEENVQDVPLAITAMSSEQLEKAGVAQFYDLAQAAPSVVWTPTTARKDASGFGIRGQRADDTQLTSDQAVAVLIGSVPMNWTYGAGISGAFDIASVEVAKGPQGTLFGKNSTGGAIIITPAEPIDSVEGLIKIGAGNYHLRQIEGMYNQPLTDTLALRIAAMANKQDGTFDNVTHNGTDLSSSDQWAARISLKWQPTSALSSLLVFEDLYSSSSGPAFRPIIANPNNTIGAIYAPAHAIASNEDFFSIRTDLRNGGYNDTKMWGVLSTTTFEVSENITIKNIAGIRDVWYEGLGDLDGVSADITNGNNPVTIAGVSAQVDAQISAGALPSAARSAAIAGGLARLDNIQFNSFQTANAQSVTEELQLIGSYDPVDWIGGLYYSHTDGDDYSITQQFNGVGNLSVAGPINGLTNETIAIFGQSTWHLTDRLNLTTGLRYTKDDREVNLGSQNLANPVPGGQAAGCLMRIEAINPATGAPMLVAPSPCNLKLNKSFHEPTWNLSVDYKLTNSQLIYAATRRGYRTGGFPGRAQLPANSQPFDPETVVDYEIGYKLEEHIAGMPIRINTAIFHQDYKDIQRNITLTQGNLLLTDVRNAAAATVSGAEVEFAFLPIDDLEINGYVSYIDASFDRWDEQTAAGVVDRSRNTFTAIPELSANLSARYRLPLPASIGEVSVSGNVYYQDETALYVDNLIDASGNECKGSQQNSYKTYGARLDWSDPFGVSGLKVGAWGKNLGDEEYYLSGLCLYNQAGFTLGYPADPRTYGLNISYKF